MICYHKTFAIMSFPSWLAGSELAGIYHVYVSWQVYFPIGKLPAGSFSG